MDTSWSNWVGYRWATVKMVDNQEQESWRLLVKECIAKNAKMRTTFFKVLTILGFSDFLGFPPENGGSKSTSQRDCLHREIMDFLSLSTALHSCQNILSEKKQWTFLRRQEVLLSPKDMLSRVVANYPVLEV